MVQFDAHPDRRIAAAIALLLFSGPLIGQTPWSESLRYEAQGDYAAAILALESVVDSEPAHEFAALRTAWLKYLLGDYNASIRDYERALELNAASLEAQLGLTLPLLAQRRWREAAVAARAVLASAPWNYYAHVRLMVAEEGQRQWQTLADHAAEVAARFPGDATVLVYLARAHARQGDPEAARAAYARVLERIPGHVEAENYLAQNSR